MLRVLFFSFLLSAHPVHVSLTSVVYIPAKHAFDVFVKVWEDDFIRDYKLTYTRELNIDSLNSLNLDREDAGKYINDKIQIIAGDKKLSGVIKNLDISDAEIKFNLSYKFKGDVNNFTVRNLIMTELYQDQNNMLIFKYKGIEEGIKFTSDIIEQTFTTK
jgi:hypothetical protein